MGQPTPKVIRADVERVVHRDFPAAVFSDILRLLDEYGRQAARERTEENYRRGLEAVQRLVEPMSRARCLVGSWN